MIRRISQLEEMPLVTVQMKRNPMRQPERTAGTWLSSRLNIKAIVPEGGKM